MDHDRPAVSLRARDLLFLLGAGMVCVFVSLPAAPRMRFQYDEADYMVAARMGFRENYLEPSSLSFPAYVKTGLQALTHRIDRTDLSESVRQRNDVSFYRHYHGPLYFQWLALVSRLTTDEGQVRGAGLVFHLLAFVTIFAGLGWLLGPEGRPAAYIASGAYLFSVGNVKTALGVSTHQMYAWIAILTLFVIGRFLVAGRTRHLLAAVGGAAVAVCILEYAVLLLVVLAAGFWMGRRRLLAMNPELGSSALAVKAAGVFAGVCAILWPAGVFKLSMLKGFLAIPFLAFMRKDSFGKAGLADIWSARAGAAPVEYALLLLCFGAAVYALTRFRSRPELAAFALYAGLILLITFKSDTERYMSSAPPALYVVGGVVLADAWRRWSPDRGRRAGLVAAAAGLVLLAASAVVALPAAPSAAAAKGDDTVSFVSRQRDRMRSVLAPAGCVPTLHYYVPDLTVRSYLPEAGPEHVRRRINAEPVEALLVYRAADARVSAGLGPHFNAERVVGPENADSGCGPFVVYFLDGAGERTWRP